MNCNCCDQKYVVVDVTGCGVKPKCADVPVVCPDGTFPEHPSFKLFSIDPRFSLFKTLLDTDKGKSSINYLMWVYEDDYLEFGYKGYEMLHYHVAHLLYSAVVNAITEAQAKQLSAAKGMVPQRLITETIAEGASSIVTANSDFYTTPFGRTLVTLKDQFTLGFLAL